MFANLARLAAWAASISVTFAYSHTLIRSILFMTPAPVFPALPKTGRKFAASISEPAAVAQPLLLFALQLLLHFGKVERAHRLLDRRETFQKDLGIRGEEAHRHDLRAQLQALLFDLGGPPPIITSAWCAAISASICAKRSSVPSSPPPLRGTPNCLPHRQVPTFIALPFRSDLILILTMQCSDVTASHLSPSLIRFPSPA